ncbi:MAG: phage terminase large subunit family protein, partial [Deltaproteobacteria bacterium]|nr:phage terminase large subunit family protein [Deltaproteobacteria bacterium]
MFRSIDQRFGGSGRVKPALDWARETLLDGRPFDLENHGYQAAMFQEDAPRQVFKKGAQVGVTSVCMLKTIHGLISGRYPQGVLYLFPSRGDTLDFSRGRFAPLLNDNPHIASHVQDTDAVNIKRIGEAMLYLRGAKSTGRVGGTKRSSSQLKSVPVDRIVFDESDEMAPAMIDLARERISHSEVKEEVYLSTPSIPDYGVDFLYQGSDQRVWMIRCEKCNHETCLELEFPDCLVESPDGRVIRVCVHCGQEVHPRNGRWVAQYPDRSRDLVGWWISQLNSAYVDPALILSLYQNPPHGNLGEVYNSKLGMAYVEAENRLSVQEVLGLCGDTGMASQDRGPCFMGVDQGKDLHVVIGKRHPVKAGQIVHLGVYKDWEELDRLVKAFNVSRCVVDALPETRNARAFAERHRGKVFLNYYNEHQKGSYKWNERDLVVQCNRTESLDASHNEVMTGQLILPRESGIVREFARHLHNVAKKLEEDQETSSR